MTRPDPGAPVDGSAEPAHSTSREATPPDGDAAPPAGRAIDLTPSRPDGSGHAPAAMHGSDPLRLCIFTTVALLAWLAGPWAVVFFAGLGFAGYWRARRRGLLRSRCLLGDTRIVLVYLGAVAAVAGWAIARQLGA